MQVSRFLFTPQIWWVDFLIMSFLFKSVKKYDKIPIIYDILLIHGNEINFYKVNPIFMQMFQKLKNPPP